MRGNAPVVTTTRGTGSMGTSTPAVAASAPDHAPAASTTALAATGPREVRPPVTAPDASPSIAVTDVPTAKVTPPRRASVAYPWLRPPGSVLLSLGADVLPLSA